MAMMYTNTRPKKPLEEELWSVSFRRYGDDYLLKGNKAENWGKTPFAMAKLTSKCLLDTEVNANRCPGLYQDKIMLYIMGL